MLATTLVTLLMAAVEALSVMVPALVSLTMMMAAFMAFSLVMPAIVAFPVMMAVVVTSGIGIILQRAVCKSLCCRVGRTGNPAVKPNPCFGQRSLSAHADAAANQRIRLRGFQKAGQRTVAAAVGGNDLFRDDPAALHVIELELFRVAEMLEDLSVFISYRNSHSI